MFFRRKKEETPEEKLNRMLTRLGEQIVILEGIMFACDNYSTIISLILEADDPKASKENLVRIYGVSAAQSQAIIDMRMRALTKLERKKLLDECQECRSRYEELQKEKVNLETGFKEEKKFISHILMQLDKSIKVDSGI